jgi:hypothetical protein
MNRIKNRMSVVNSSENATRFCLPKIKRSISFSSIYGEPKNNPESEAVESSNRIQSIFGFLKHKLNQLSTPKSVEKTSSDILIDKLEQLLQVLNPELLVELNSLIENNKTVIKNEMIEDDLSSTQNESGLNINFNNNDNNQVSINDSKIENHDSVNHLKYVLSSIEQNFNAYLDKLENNQQPNNCLSFDRTNWEDKFFKRRVDRRKNSVKPRKNRRLLKPSRRISKNSFKLAPRFATKSTGVSEKVQKFNIIANKTETEKIDSIKPKNLASPLNKSENFSFLKSKFENMSKNHESKTSSRPWSPKIVNYLYNSNNLTAKKSQIKRKLSNFECESEHIMHVNESANLESTPKSNQFEEKSISEIINRFSTLKFGQSLNIIIPKDNLNERAHFLSSTLLNSGPIDEQEINRNLKQLEIDNFLFQINNNLKSLRKNLGILSYDLEEMSNEDLYKEKSLLEQHLFQLDWKYNAANEHLQSNQLYASLTKRYRIIRILLNAK